MQTILHILRQAGGWHHGLSLRIEKQWDTNLHLQGFAEAFEQQQTPRA
jgi:hypothetical protein